MNVKISFIVITFLFSTTLFAQQMIDVTDQKIKVGAFKEESLYFGFAEGDKVIFNFEEVDGKELKEVEIIEYPSNSKFSDYKTSKIENKTLNISRKSVYIFRFKNTSLAGRICRIQIQRIAASDGTKDFNSNVRWITKQDTTWNSYTKAVVIGYDTTYVQRKRKEVENVERKEVSLLDKTERVHSITNDNGNKSSVFFTLPQNQTSAYYTSKVISWAYWVGVGEESNRAWQQNVKTISTLAKGAATVYATPLGALAIGAITSLATPSLGEDVVYYVTNSENKDLFYRGVQFRTLDYGKGVAGYKNFTMDGALQGTYFVCLSNDNMVQGINATIKVIAIVETTTYKDVSFTETVVTPRYEQRIMRDPVITTSTVPVSGM